MAMLTWPRHDVQGMSIPGATVEVYRRDDDLVVGPCLSLNVDGIEVLRIDLPPGKAHEHWAGLPSKPRLYYPRTWPHQRLVELACSNLVEHAKIACSLAGVDAPERSDLEAVATWAAPLLAA